MVRIQPDPPTYQGETDRIAPGWHCFIWGISSAGRAPALQAGGRRFDPVILHQILEVSGMKRKRIAYDLFLTP